MNSFTLLRQRYKTEAFYPHGNGEEEEPRHQFCLQDIFSLPHSVSSVLNDQQIIVSSECITHTHTQHKQVHVCVLLTATQ